MTDNTLYEMPQFFFEIYQEEIPARMQVEAAKQLKELLGKILADLTIDYQSIHTMVTPLRHIGYVEGIADKRSTDLVSLCAVHLFCVLLGCPTAFPFIGNTLASHPLKLR
mgnify:CR=1 FL=1